MKYIYLTVFLLGTSFIVIGYLAEQHSTTIGHNIVTATPTEIYYHDEVIPNNEIQTLKIKQKTNMDYAQVETQVTHIPTPIENVIGTGTKEQFIGEVISDKPLLAGEENAEMFLPGSLLDTDEINEPNGSSYNAAEDYDFVEEYINYDAITSEEVIKLARLYQKINSEEQAAFFEYLEPILNEAFGLYEINEPTGSRYNDIEDNADYLPFLSSDDPISAIEAEEIVEEYINYDAITSEEVVKLTRLYQKVNPEEQAAFLEYLEPILNEAFGSQIFELEQSWQ